jgi:hypothetical protein
MWSIQNRCFQLVDAYAHNDHELKLFMLNAVVLRLLSELPGYQTLAEINAKYRTMKDGEVDDVDDEPPLPRDRGHTVSIECVMHVMNYWPLICCLFSTYVDENSAEIGLAVGVCSFVC